MGVDWFAIIYTGLPVISVPGLREESSKLHVNERMLIYINGSYIKVMLM